MEPSQPPPQPAKLAICPIRPISPICPIPTPATPPPDDPAKLALARIAEAGFPLRQRRNLSRMHGPGLAAAQLLLPRILGGDCLILLLGDRGPGKTQIATWLAHRRLIERPDFTKGRYIKSADLIAGIKSTWSDPARRAGPGSVDILKKYRTASFLVIDDIHERGASAWETSIFNNLIDHRYDAMLATILIANMTEEKATLEINPSILSRANETGGLFLCDWPSYREVGSGN